MSKPRHGGHLIAEALKQEGTRYLFTLSGGHIAPIYDGCVDNDIRVVDFRHEQAAAHAADGWARVTLQPGVAAVTAGPGVTDAVTGIANAYYANSPILVLSGKNPIFEFERGSLQEMDQTALVSPITKWARTCYEVRRIPDFVAAAFRHAMSGRKGPVFVDFPLDVQFNAAPPEAKPAERYRTDAKPLGDPDLIEEAVRLLGGAQRPLVFAGAGVRWADAHEALHELAHALKAPVFLNSLGRGCLPPEDPYFFSAARKFALGRADVLAGSGPVRMPGGGAFVRHGGQAGQARQQVLIVYGDGSFGLNAMEYESAIRQGTPFVGIIGNDGAWGQIKVAQEALDGSGNAPASGLDQEAPYHKMVEGLGGYGQEVTSPGGIRPALRRAFDSEVPACINVMVDPSLMKRTSYLV
jgi:thiamine pyrophosphate-dependent acetolactate synthase large subunit-like protein